MNYLNKIIRSATVENMADTNGVPNVQAFVNLYRAISARTIITGFVYVSENGRAMQPLQAGIVNQMQADAWANVRQALPDKQLIMQLAHVGRQTTRSGAVGASNIKCTYCKASVRALTKTEIEEIVQDFAQAALRAKQAGFDGVQIHAAHGYLIHQFLSPYTNNRIDEYKDKPLLLEQVLKAVRVVCPASFIVWVKLSHGDDRGLTLSDTLATIKRIETLCDGIEISYGTMEYALNIIRGAIPIDTAFQVNPLFNKYPPFIQRLWKRFVFPFYKRRFKPFTPNYNVQAALEIKKQTSLPVFVTGGIRTQQDIDHLLASGIDKVSLCRPFIKEPDLLHKLTGDWKSGCVNCNLCTIYCDSTESVRCHLGEKNEI